MVMRLIAMMIMITSAIMCGCRTDKNLDYVEGTSITLGLYVPIDGQFYGIQLFHYLSGMRITSMTNVAIKSSHAISNHAWGVTTSHIKKSDVQGLKK